MMGTVGDSAGRLVSSVLCKWKLAVGEGEYGVEMSDKEVTGLSADFSPRQHTALCSLSWFRLSTVDLNCSHSSPEASHLPCVLNFPDSSINCGLPWKIYLAAIAV